MLRPLCQGLCLAMLAMLLAGCGGPDDPLHSLNAAADSLQRALDEKQTSEVMALLHPEFGTDQGMDAQWARRTMTGLFLRHRTVSVVVLKREAELAPGALDAARVEALVVLVGAERLVPDAARQYRVRSEWRRDGADGDWRLFWLGWE